MQKIISKEEKEKSESKKRRIIVIIVSAIMLLSTLGYSFMSFGGKGNKNRVNYKGIEFNLNEYGWNFEIQGFSFLTSYLPGETENISINIIATAQDYYQKPLYFSLDSQQEGIREIETNLNPIVSRMQYACLEENCTEYAIKNCSVDNIITITSNDKNESFISQEGKCISISASNGEMARASDRFLFKILGLN